MRATLAAILIPLAHIASLAPTTSAHDPLECDGYWELINAPPPSGGTSTKVIETDVRIGVGYISAKTAAQPLATRNSHVHLHGESNFPNVGGGGEKNGEKYESWTWNGEDHGMGRAIVSVETKTGGGQLWHNAFGDANQTISCEQFLRTSITRDLHIRTGGTIGTSGANSEIKDIFGVPVPFENPGSGTTEQDLDGDTDHHDGDMCVTMFTFQSKSRSYAQGSAEGTAIGYLRGKKSVIDSDIHWGKDTMDALLLCCGIEDREIGTSGEEGTKPDVSKPGGDLELTKYYEALDKKKEEEEASKTPSGSDSAAGN